LVFYDLWQGDLEPAIALTLTGITDLTQATSVSFHMVQVDGTKRVTGTALVSDPTTTDVAYVWQPGDTDTPGVYRAVFKVIYPTASPETFPSDDVLYVLIRPAL
jgi:hypothetical protein